MKEEIGKMERREDRKHVCPWWLCFTFDNPFRRVLHNPSKLLSPYIHKGDMVIDVGAGMGYFSIPLAELVGPSGRVIAIDIQLKMLSALVSRARKKGVSERIKTHLADPGAIGIHEKADFILAFWMVHEVSNRRQFFSEIRSLMKPGGQFLMVEPIVHVSREKFLRTIETANELGFFVKDSPKIRISHSVLLGCRQNGP
jgi:ubiquinone/menaquinone biosynthesis C-methylase UbiE